jgi:DNA-binding MarR family transcriptional regulator
VDSAAQELLRALRDYAAAAREASLEGLVKLKLTENDLKAVRFLLANPGALARDLKEHLQVSSPSITTLLDRLEGRGFIRREASDLDRRAVNLYALVDPVEEPWASLDRFDRLAGAIAGAWPTDTVHSATALVDAMRQGVTAENAKSQNSMVR